MCLCSEGEIVIHSTTWIHKVGNCVVIGGFSCTIWCSKSGLQFLEVEPLLLLLVLVELCCSNSVFFCSLWRWYHGFCICGKTLNGEDNGTITFIVVVSVRLKRWGYIKGDISGYLRWLNKVLAGCEYMSFAKSLQEKGSSSQAETWQVKNILIKDFDWQIKFDVFVVSMATWTIEYNLKISPLLSLHKIRLLYFPINLHTAYYN